MSAEPTPQQLEQIQQHLEKRLGQVTECVAAFGRPKVVVTTENVPSEKNIVTEKPTEERSNAAVEPSVELEKIIKDYNETSVKFEQLRRESYSTAKKQTYLLAKMISIQQSDIVTQTAIVATAERTLLNEKQLLQQFEIDLEKYNALHQHVRLFKVCFNFLHLIL